jgi:hypothetical protein
VVSKWKCFSFTSAIHLDVNLLHHRVQISDHIGIPEADDPIAFPLQPGLPFAIARGCRIIVMVPAIEFDDQSPCRTEEVDDIGTDWRLPPEVSAFDWQLFQNSQRMRSCGVVLARSFFAAPRRIAGETIEISLVERSPHPARSRHCRLLATLPLQGRVKSIAI